MVRALLALGTYSVGTSFGRVNVPVRVVQLLTGLRLGGTHIVLLGDHQHFLSSSSRRLLRRRVGS